MKDSVTTDQEVFVVQLQGYTDLTETEQMGASRNGWGPEYANYLRVTYRGETIFLESDAMEPEDARLSRDLRWVIDAISRAYVLGTEEGKRYAGK